MACFRPRGLAVGLLQLGIGTFTGFNVGTTLESRQCCCPDVREFETTRSREIGASLFANCRENQVQTLPLGTPCDQWSSTVIFDWIGHLCSRRTSQVELLSVQKEGMIWSSRDQDWFCPSRSFLLRHQELRTVCPSTLDWLPTPNCVKRN